jgi:hypothetical protein
MSKKEDSNALHIPLINIHIWKSKTKKETVQLDNSGKQPSNKPDIVSNIISSDIIIFQDDKMADALNKINEILNPGIRMYAWKNDVPLRFHLPVTTWKHYNVNPFFSKPEKDLASIVPTIEFKNMLFELQELNVAFENDVPDYTKENKHYFYDFSAANQQFSKISKYLFSIYDSPPASIEHTYFNKAYIIGQIHIKDIINNIFPILQPTIEIPLIKWNFDSTKQEYKLFSEHTFSKEQLEKRLIEQQLPINEKIIVLYPYTKEDTICQCFINQNGNIDIYYKSSLRQRQTSTNIDTILQSLYDFLKLYSPSLFNIQKQYDLNFQYASINAQIGFGIQNTTLKKLNDVFSKLPIFFKNVNSTVLNKTNKLSFQCLYARSSLNMNNSFDTNEFIKQRILLGASNEDILKDLKLFDTFKPNTNRADRIDAERNLINTIEIIRNSGDFNIKKTNIKQSNNKSGATILNIDVNEKQKNILNVIVNDCPNEKELEYIKIWISKIMNHLPPETKVQQLIKKAIEEQKKVDDETNIPKQGDVNKPPEQEFFINDDSSTSKSDSKTSQSSSSSNVKSGGAKTNKISLNALLLAADPELFSAKNEYTAKCQLNRQPVAISKDTYEKYGNKFDNILEYGSSPDKTSYFGCPRLWCPISKIPLHPEKDKELKCPGENEEFINLYSNKTVWKLKDHKHPHDIPKYVGVHAKKTEDGLCLPCCYIKENKSRVDQCLKDRNTHHKPTSKPDSKPEASDNNIQQKSSKMAEQAYIISLRDPLPKNRLGASPKQIHDVLYNSESNINDYTMCTSTLKKHSCVFRKGIANFKDTFFNSLLDSLKISKEQFIEKMSKLTFFEFISLENGHIIKHFSNNSETNDEHSGKKTVLKFKDNWFPKDLEIDKSIKSIIYNAFENFVSYIRSPRTKNPVYFYSLVAIIFKKLIVLWDWEEDDSVSLICPAYISYNQLLISLGADAKFLMILKNDKQYEPMIHRIGDAKEFDGIFELKNHNNVKNVIEKCNTMFVNNTNIIGSNPNNNKKSYNEIQDVYNKVLSFHIWLKTQHSEFSKEYQFNEILINSDFTFDTCLLHNNMTIKLKTNMPSSFIYHFIDQFGVSKITFFDNKPPYKISSTLSNFTLFMKNIKRFEFEPILYIKQNLISQSLQNQHQHEQPSSSNPFPFLNTFIDKTKNKIKIPVEIPLQTRPGSCILI